MRSCCMRVNDPRGEYVMLCSGISIRIPSRCKSLSDLLQAVWLAPCAYINLQAVA
jgi:hypothetical protein